MKNKLWYRLKDVDPEEYNELINYFEISKAKNHNKLISVIIMHNIDSLKGILPNRLLIKLEEASYSDEELEEIYTMIINNIRG